MGTIKQQDFVKSFIHIFQLLPEEINVSYKRKWKELIEKELNQQLHIAFVGHFSAGKSTLLNKLVNGAVLPSSPLPTSSNIVMLAKGETATAAYFMDGKIYEWKEELTDEFIRKLCKQGANIERVLIQRPHFTIHDHLLFIDSPGIDSTDDDHRKRTESALHLADCIVYVADYHHVQSELNFSFLKKLLEMNKPLIVVINQIDKHNEKEVAFSAYQDNIEASLTALGIRKDDIFYTSLKFANHPFNQYGQLEKRFMEMVFDRTRLIQENMVEQAKILFKEMKEGLSDKKANQFGLSLEDWRNVEHLLSSGQEKIAETEQKLRAFQEEIGQFETAFDKELESLLKNANLMPFSTREKAEKVIETQKKDFKAGWFFAKRKTEEIKQKTLSEFHEEINKNVETQIGWHLSNMLKTYYEQLKLEDEALLKQIFALKLPISEEMLLSVIKPQAELNGQYVLQYGKDVTNAIQQFCKKEALSLRERLKEALVLKNQEEKERALQKKEELTARMIKWSKALEEQEKLNKAFEELERILNHPSDVSDIDVDQWISANLTKRMLKEDELTARLAFHEEKEISVEKLNNIEKERQHNREKVIEKLKKSVIILTEAGLDHSAGRLKDKLLQLENRTFQIAIFGAFSAGKSSFLNAMIGEKIFPASPTPTTAVINKLTGVTAEKKHGCVEVAFKTEQKILQEINELLKPFSIRADHFADLQKALITSLEQTGNVMTERRLKTFLEGIRYYERENKPESKTISIDDLERFVAKEEIACLIEEVVIYYDCHLTRKGITLVDTPGANSFHGRHTDLAFQYIKHADAIIFLTYFNHPFSKGDQQFLNQLGLVKDAFTFDKMFFIINAIDLAENEQDARDVRNYVEEMLNRHSIRNPKLFQVSSLYAMEGKTAKAAADEFSLFLESFDHFIQHELMTVFIQAAEYEFQAAVNEMAEMVKLMRLDENEREAKGNELNRQLIEIGKTIRSYPIDEYIKSLQQEAEELNYYVKQRIVYKLPELFKQAYEPSRFMNARGNEKKVLMECFQELINSLEIYLRQELNATTLRLDKHVNHLLQQMNEKLSGLISGKYVSVLFAQTVERKLEELDVNLSVSAFLHIDAAKAHKVFRNTKSFFEQNEKQKLFNLLEHELEKGIEKAVKAGENEMIHHFKSLMEREFSKEKEKMMKEAEKFVTARIKTLKAPHDMNGLTEKLQQLQNLS